MEEKEIIDILIEEISSYQCDWTAIAKENQWVEEKTDADAEIYKVKKFCAAIRHIRQLLHLSYREMGESIGYSHTRIADIENNKIKILPVDKLEHIAGLYKTSVAYLIGLSDDMSYSPNQIEKYFWEHPKSPYIALKDKVIEKAPIELKKSLGNMIAPVPDSIDKIKNDIIRSIGNNYSVAISIKKLLDAKPDKRYKILKILEYLKDL